MSTRLIPETVPSDSGKMMHAGSYPAPRSPMSPIGEGRVTGVQFGVVINAESCMGWKPHKLEGCRGLNNFFSRLGVTTEFCWGDTNVSGCLRGAPRCTPAGAVMKGVFSGVGVGANTPSALILRIGTVLL